MRGKRTLTPRQLALLHQLRATTVHIRLMRSQERSLMLRCYDAYLPLSEIARTTGIHPSTVHRWVAQERARHLPHG